ncbi:MAG: hypothetical protein RLZZ499_1550, partial [Cyanobacteriota bacterium]
MHYVDIYIAELFMFKSFGASAN